MFRAPDFHSLLGLPTATSGSAGRAPSSRSLPAVSVSCPFPSTTTQNCITVDSPVALFPLSHPVPPSVLLLILPAPPILYINSLISITYDTLDISQTKNEGVYRLSYLHILTASILLKYSHRYIPSIEGHSDGTSAFHTPTIPRLLCPRGVGSTKMRRDSPAM
jgi:hypothetical protein